MKKNFMMIGVLSSALLISGTLGLYAKPPATATTTAELTAQLEAALTAIGTNYTSANIGTNKNNWNTGSRTMLAIVKKFNSNQYKGEKGGNSIYIKIQGFFDARETQAVSDAKYLTNLKALLDRAKTATFLDNNQKAIVKGWAAQVKKQITDQIIMNVINKAAAITTLQKKVVVLKNIAAKYHKVVVSEAVQTAFFNEIKSINNGLYELYLKTKTAEPIYTDEEKSLAATWVQAAPKFPLGQFRVLLNYCSKPNFKLISSDQINYVRGLKTNFAKFNVMVETIKTVK
jgi:hypothetical protein